MKDFLKFTFASVIGVILAGVVFTILGIITLVGIVASSDTETVVKDNSIFVLDFKGSLSERVQENPLQQLLGEEFEAYGLDDILASIKKAKDNDKIKGIYIQPSYLEASYASLEEIRNALLDFKESGKFIVAYADQYAQGMYYLSSVADKIIINPQGSIGWHGAGMQPVFFKNLVSKLGLEVQVFRVGTYKSAVEPFIATEMSPANREQMTECLEAAVQAKGVPMLDKTQVIKILTDGGTVCGLLCLNTAAQDAADHFTLIRCKNVIWATGGPAGMYADSVYPFSQYGATGLALEAGAKGKNLTEWQYGLASVALRWNVSGTYMQVLPRVYSTAADGSDEREFLMDFFSDVHDMLSNLFLKGYQ